VFLAAGVGTTTPECRDRRTGEVSATSTLLVPHAPESVGVVRHRCVDALRRLGVPAARIDDAALVLSELVGNAVRHGKPLDGVGVEVRWEVRGSFVRLEVRDGGRGPLRHEASRPLAHGGSADAEGGRGLAIVGVLATSWGSAFDATEAVVWADVPVGVTAEVASGRSRQDA
jgi:anti-sigma regulatory factor (Ser/Thr protein kinase)